MRAIPLLAALLLAAPVAAQEEPLPLEELLKRVTKELEAMRQEFDKALEQGIGVLGRAAPTSEAAREARRELQPWVGVFPEVFVRTIRTAASQRVRSALLQVVAASGEKSVAPRLLALIEARDGEQDAGFRAEVLQALARLGNREVAGDVQELATSGVKPVVLAAALRTLAALEHPDARDLAVQHLDNDRPEVRKAAVEALAVAARGERENAGLLLERYEKERDDDVRAALVEALGFFPHFTVIRALHEILETAEPPVLDAALKAVARVGKGDLSGPYVLKVVNRKELPLETRREAARILLDWGDPKGALALYRREREVAEQNPRSWDAQVALGDVLRRLGAYEVALESYSRALPLGSRNQVRAVHERMARCYAGLERFREAIRHLKLTERRLSAFARDQDFKELAEDPRFAGLFKK